MAAEFPVVHLKIRHRAAGLTPPAVAAQYLLAQTFIRQGSRRKLPSLRRIILTTPSPEAYRSIRAELEARGEMIGNNDLWIAAHAVVAGLTLVTNNESEFRRVRGLKIQNWAL